MRAETRWWWLYGRHLHIKSSGKHCPTTVTVCEHEGSLMSTQSSSSLPALRQLRTRSGRQSATAWSEMLWRCLENRLWFPVVWQPESHFVCFISLRLKNSQTKTVQVVLLEINDLLSHKCVASVQIWCVKLGLLIYLVQKKKRRKLTLIPNSDDTFHPLFVKNLRKPVFSPPPRRSFPFSSSRFYFWICSVCPA